MNAIGDSDDSFYALKNQLAEEKAKQKMKDAMEAKFKKDQDDARKKKEEAAKALDA